MELDLENMSDQERWNLLEDFVNKHQLSITSYFIPFSVSRNHNEKRPSLNWKISISNKKGAVVFDYSAGMAHMFSNTSEYNTKLHSKFEAIAAENGKWTDTFSGGHTVPKPSIYSILYSIGIDSDSLLYDTFEDYCNNFGLNPDSIKEKRTYEDSVKNISNFLLLLDNNKENLTSLSLICRSIDEHNSNYSHPKLNPIMSLKKSKLSL